MATDSHGMGIELPPDATKIHQFPGVVRLAMERVAEILAGELPQGVLDAVDAAAGPAVDLALDQADVITGDDPRAVADLNHPDYAYLLRDRTSGRMALGIRKDGTVEIPALDPVKAGVVGATDARLVTTINHPNYAYLVRDPSTGRMALGIRPNGTVEIPALELSTANMAATAAAADLLTRSDVTRWFAFGDSITEGGSPAPHWPTVLAASLPGGSTVTNRGVSGQTSGSVAVRQGGIVLTLAAMTIPADTSAATIAHTPSVAPCNLQNNPAIAGTLAGVPGILRPTTAGAGTFTRTTAGTAVAVPANTPFKPDHATGNEYGAQVLWTGRNDVAFAWPNIVTGVQAATRAMVAHMVGDLKRYLVVSVTTSSGEGIGGAASRADVLAINDALKTEWPKQYVDMRRHIIDNGLALAGITPTQADLDAVAADTLPPSLLEDGLHPNAKCKEFVIAPKFRSELALRGWI